MKILIIDGSKEFVASKGKLNESLVEYAKKSLTEKGHEVQVTKADADYKGEEEVQKILWADVLLWQFPIWWFGTPWHVKKYLDEVFFYALGKIWASDGRTRKDPSKKYGSGGLAQGKKFMLSFTWNAPVESLTEPDQFFH
ncbi:Modulator of drug activity B, putative [Trichomonas vaginalis G3]|uniref:Modulator of drug activity B, putative n=1 Tax=Trichomonas vaginalis (strain ATCC PRA-98 / G3) TaxID=412133 RepID=A2EXN3_TRIV3|nr:flavodoxin-like fold [Trichomonas vaginalis G3]EAY02590.1 Modulator of drug activity B, putative [Trichomonas vaginalis G3]KAI5512564.1 flavodoxin-like fold [Trichomonas vaginalis G3]|eukprot:XP_001314813.1 Modulator of drug activity B [Trichomonas vaginalis G3]